MKNIFKILITLSLVFITLNANEDLYDDMNDVKDTSIGTNESPFGEVSIVPEANPETKPAIDETLIAPVITDMDEDSIYADPNLGTTSEDTNESILPVSDMNAFEKLFVNHSAYIYYSKGVEELYKSNYKAAYENAMKAKEIIDNTDKLSDQVIALPYMPSYVRETAYTPKRIYYKIVKAKRYELRKLIVKAKLISPPIASVVIKKTSTYMDVIVRNYGDLPLDEFEVLINDEPIMKYEKVLPNEKKVIRVDRVNEFHEISFKEKYGFAPSSIMLSEDE